MGSISPRFRDSGALLPSGWRSPSGTLFNKVEGPGDLEVLIHIENQSFKPIRVPTVLAYLTKNGVNLEHDLKEVFRANKKLDVFIKDQFALENGRGYTGEFGEFAEMGDTSVNELRYSPTLNLVDGKNENLEALSQHKILYLEKDKVAPKAKPSKIAGLKGESSYSPMILRMALRSLRLETELYLAENPNHLTLDQSFIDVLAGFELFFQNISPEEIHKYSVNEVYLEQFKKLFRNRSLKETKKIVAFLEAHHPKTLEIWNHLGLDYGAFLQTVRKDILKSNREFRAVVKNARYRNLGPFLDKDFTVRNPFESEGLQSKLLELCVSVRNSKINHWNGL